MRLLREELMLLHEAGSYVGEVVKAMGKTKVLVKVPMHFHLLRRKSNAHLIDRHSFTLIDA